MPAIGRRIDGTRTVAKKKLKKAARPAAKSRSATAKRPGAAAKTSGARKAARSQVTAGKKVVKKNPARKPASRPARRPTLPANKRNSKPVPPVVIPPAVPIGEVPSGLSKRDIAELREALIRKRHEILGDVATMRNEALSRNRQDAAGDLSNMPLHPADVGSDHYEQEFTLGLIESERQIVREIDEALLRIQKGIYGICAATGRPIGLARLRVMPWAKYCYEYVLAQERGLLPRG